MAALGPSNVDKAFADGRAETIVLFAIKRVSTGDTLDLSPWMTFVKVAAIIGGTRTGSPTVVNVGADGTTVTFNPAGIANDAVWLVCWGVA